MKSPHIPLISFQALLAMAQSLVFPFVVTFVVKAGGYEGGAALFYMLAFLAALLVLPLAPRFLRRPYFSMCAAMVVLTLFFISLILVPPSLFPLCSLLMGAYVILFWMPYNVLVARLVRREERGRGVSVYFLVFPAVSVVSPLLGGYIAEVFGYSALFGVALSLTATNAALIALLSSRLPRPSFPPPASISPLSSPLGIAFLFNGFMDGMFWVAIPLLLFEVAGSEGGLGRLLAVVSLGGALASVFAGHLSDKRGERVPFAFASSLAASVFLLSTAPFWGVWLSVLLLAGAYFSLTILYPMMFSLTVDLREEDIAGGMMMRELSLNAGRALGLLSLFLLISLGAIWLALPAAGLAIAGASYFLRRCGN